MNPLKNILPYSVLFLAASCMHAAAQTSVVVRDFSAGGFDYGFEDWKDLSSVQSKTANGVELKGTAKGGAGVFFADTPIDLSDCTQLEVKVRQGASNTQEKLLVRLQSADGKSTLMPIALTDVHKDALDLVIIDLAPFKKATDAVTWKSVTGVQVQGDFNPATFMDFELGSISGKKPAPAK